MEHLISHLKLEAEAEVEMEIVVAHLKLEVVAHYY